ncbi:MAG: rod shape-determining protein MreD [Alphaproteobacteria bacterium]
MEGMVWQRLESLARRLSPLLITVLFSMASVMPLHIPGLAPVAPALSLMAVYYWAIFRPDLLPAPLVFVAGVFQGVLSGLPLGVEALVLVSAFGIVSSQRRFFLGKSFVVMWWGFLLVAAGALSATWVMVSALRGAVIDPSPVLLELVMTLALFPFVTWILVRAQRGLLRQI